MAILIRIVIVERVAGAVEVPIGVVGGLSPNDGTIGAAGDCATARDCYGKRRRT